MAEESTTGEAEPLAQHLLEHHCVHGAVSAEVTHSHVGIFAYEQERRGWRRLLGSPKRGLCAAESSCLSNAPIITDSWDVKDRKLYFEAPTATITCSQGHSQVATGRFEADNPSAPTSFADTIASKEWPCATCGVNRSMTVDPGPEET
ncbi:hypothetical protein V865_005913 [Kwoniella europaea PYCC6329]|uniref:Uncharacterized protein n=1 Tax=Kwoniella europaea PYCC6329 TaxID=1423913 RepID=A0AAX4KPC8_9TREE